MGLLHCASQVARGEPRLVAGRCNERNPMSNTLTTEQRDRYQRDGYVHVPGLAAAAGEDLNSWVEEVASTETVVGRWLHHHELTAAGKRLARTEDFLPYHQGLSGLLTRGVVVSAIEQLFGEPGVVLKEKINYKHPGGGGYAPHQDAPAYDFASRHITCAIAVDEATVENGCLWFAAGHHTSGLLPQDDRGCLAAATADAMTWAPCPLAVGDGVFFSSLAPHYSEKNESARSRRSLYVTYNPAGDGDFRQEYYASKRGAHRAGAKNPA